MAFNTVGTVVECAICGRKFIKGSNNAKYCSTSCKNKAWKAQSQAWLREYKRQLREEQRRLISPYKPRETIEEVVAKANAAGMTYGKYVALQRELEGCEIYGRCEVDQDNH